MKARQITSDGPSRFGTPQVGYSGTCELNIAVSDYRRLALTFEMEASWPGARLDAGEVFPECLPRRLRGKTDSAGPACCCPRCNSLRATGFCFLAHLVWKAAPLLMSALTAGRSQRQAN